MIQTLFEEAQQAFSDSQIWMALYLLDNRARCRAPNSCRGRSCSTRDLHCRSQGSWGRNLQFSVTIMFQQLTFVRGFLINVPLNVGICLAKTTPLDGNHTGLIHFPCLTDMVQPGLFYIQLCNQFAERSFYSRYSKHHKSQTIRARELKF